MAEKIEILREAGVATIVMNRPEVLNALDAEMAERLAAVTGDLAADPQVRCVVIRGGGDHFMAGGDVRQFHGYLDRPREEIQDRIGREIDDVHRAIVHIRTMPKPVVASVRGASAGFGMSLVAACDLALAAADSVFSLAYIRIGTSPDGGSTWTLPRAVGMKRAFELALLGDRITPEQAASYGVINWVVPTAELEERTAKLAKRLAGGPGAALAKTKALLNMSSALDLESQLAQEKGCFVAGVAGEEFSEGVSAFVEKRAPRFQREPGR